MLQLFLFIILVSAFLIWIFFFNNEPHNSEYLKNDSAHFLLKNDIMKSFYNDFLPNNQKFTSDLMFDAHIYFTNDNKIIWRLEYFSEYHYFGVDGSVTGIRGAIHKYFHDGYLSEVNEFIVWKTIMIDDPFSKDALDSMAEMLDELLKIWRTRYLLGHNRRSKLWTR